MRKRISLFTVLTLTLVSVLSLGATNCVEDGFRRLVETVADHEGRISELERCACDGVLAPVCGENGKTYVNGCEARCAGVEGDQSCQAGVSPSAFRASFFGTQRSFSMRWKPVQSSPSATASTSR